MQIQTSGLNSRSFFYAQYFHKLAEMVSRIEFLICLALSRTALNPQKEK